MTTLGIALGGGGAKGLAHIGVLEVLADAGIEFDVIVGTSAGALVGACYASNNLEGLIREVKRVRLADIPRLLSPSWSFGGLFSGKNVLHMLEELFAAKLIEDFPRKFGAVACDLTSGESLLFSQGSASQAVRASIAIPGIFTPVQWSGKVLVDGGVLEPVPVKRVRSLGADALIAVDLFADEKAIRSGTQAEKTRSVSYLHSLAPKRKTAQNKEPVSKLRTSAFDVLMDTLVVSQRYLTATSLKECEPCVVVKPEVGAVGLLDFHRGDAVIEIGRKAARAELLRIKRALKQSA